ncbi:MAG: RNA pyrophosphohydrolase [Pseudomonadota bacterium]
MTKSADRDAMPYRRCVGIAVFNADGKVWSGRRIANPETAGKGKHRWQLPQGGIDKGEDALLAAKRELFEETGIRSVTLLAKVSGWLYYDLPDDLLGKALKGKYRGQKQRWFAFRFEGDEAEINIEDPPDGSHPEFDQWAWKDLSELPDLIVPFKRGLYVNVANEFKAFANKSARK